MTGKKCISLEWGIKGIIQNEIKGRWGIFWKNVSERLVKKFGYPNYWQNKTSITLIENEVKINLILASTPIQAGDMFMYRNNEGKMILKIAKPKEDWNGYINCKTGENPYLKVVFYET